MDQLQLEREWKATKWDWNRQDLNEFMGEFKYLCRRACQAGMEKTDAQITLKMLSLLPAEFRSLHHDTSAPPTTAPTPSNNNMETLKLAATSAATSVSVVSSLVVGLMAVATL